MVRHIDDGESRHRLREQKEEKGEHANMGEAGFRRQLTPYTLAALGGGVGFGADSERYRITLGSSTNSSAFTRRI